MKVVLFCQSLISDWNHGNAHFLRGICSELRRRGHQVLAYEPGDSWSLRNLLHQEGSDRLPGLLAELRHHYPDLDPVRYDLGELDLEQAMDDADLVLVHEWNEPELVRRVGEHRRRRGDYRLLFHDTHHRTVSDPDALDRFHLEEYDGVLAFGDRVRDIYRRRGWGRRAWTWREAADERVFRPLPRRAEGDLVWIGNWGDAERTQDLHQFLLGPISDLELDAVVHGVRYPDPAIRAVRASGADSRGWVANYRVPEVMARFRATVHVPRRPYLEELRDVPTIRPFEAMACGIPMVSARWDDPAGLFRAGEDFLVARDREEMTDHLAALMNDEDLRAAIGRRGRRTVQERHTCAHRVDELFEILARMDGETKVGEETEESDRVPQETDTPVGQGSASAPAVESATPSPSRAEESEVSEDRETRRAEQDDPGRPGNAFARAVEDDQRARPRGSRMISSEKGPTGRSRRDER